jgi:hypothetical protein
MTLPHLFHPESTPVALDNTLHYVVLSVLQWKTPNLDVMTKAGKQRFAVLYNQPLEESFVMETLEQAHIQGAMSGVKVVAVHKNFLYLFLSNHVEGTTVPAIESLWTPIKKLDLNRGLEVDFACENEVYSGRSDYPFWPAVKEILESNVLGIEQYQVPVLHDCAEEVFYGDDLEAHALHVNIRQSFTSEPAAPTQLCSGVVASVDFMLGHTNYSMTECYVCPVHKEPDA